ncbi:MAG: DUF5335 family protein [Thermoanaerobaculia bacterium]
MQKKLSRNHWRDFADSLSRSHDGWLISVFVKPRFGKQECVARDVPFRGLTAELHGEQQAVIIATDGASHASHIIAHPREMFVRTSASGADEAVSVIDDQGVETIAEFRSPMPVLTVDGIAP